jgi:hypothetical protein
MTFTAGFIIEINRFFPDMFLFHFSSFREKYVICLIHI